MIGYRLLVILLMSTMGSAQYCVTTGKSLPSSPDTVTCWNASMAHLPEKRVKSRTKVNSCNVVFILDLGSQFVSPEDYSIIQFFMSAVIDSCFAKGVGHDIVAYPMFNKRDNTTMNCCSSSSCQQNIGFMNYNVYIPDYASINTVYPETEDTNFSYTLIDELKSIGAKCQYNTAIMISNRVFSSNIQVQLEKEKQCITFTQIIVGRGKEVTEEDVNKYYGKLSEYQYVVPDLNCLEVVADCIRPCGSMSALNCSQLDLTSCNTPTPPTTTFLPPTTTTTVDPSTGDFFHASFIFALSNRTTLDQFEMVVNHVEDRIVGCSSQQMLVRFLAPGGIESEWLSDIPSVKAITVFLKNMTKEEITLISHGPEVEDIFTFDLVYKALTYPYIQAPGLGYARVTLLTDFASETFIEQVANNTAGIVLKLLDVDFEIVTFNKVASDVYLNKSTIPKRIHLAQYNDTKYPIDLCDIDHHPDIPLSSTVIIIIVIGSVIGFALICIVATLAFRQRYIWLEKLTTFGRDPNLVPGQGSSTSEEDDDIIDYWEISWDDVIVKNDRLGHGAHGQVFRGKLRGSSPGVEHYFRAEDRINYVNCEVAIKVLPITATDKARAEFLKEIDLMKSIRYSDHIVNMLGCITSHKRIGLILEYCALGDLSRYLRRKKTDLEESRTIDNEVDCNKQFLQFGWQIAHGMEFLQQQGIIHRDLAARNILIDMWGNAKIGDFGLCIRSEDRLPIGPSATENQPESPTNAAGSSGRLPIKWLAVECLRSQQFSHKSDVWSFGIVLSEMYTLGETPFVDIEPHDLLEHLLQGGRPPRPLLACDKIHEVMQRCWKEAPEERPTFGELLTIFAILIEQSTEGYGYLQLIKASEHYKTLNGVADEKKGRAGSALSNGSAKLKEKIVPGWRKLAGALKARSVINSKAAATTPAHREAENGSARAPTPTPPAPPPALSTSIASSLFDKLDKARMKAKVSSSRDLSTSTLAVPSPAKPRLSDPSRDSRFLKVRVMEKETPMEEEENEGVPAIQVIEAVEKLDVPVSICIDGHARPTIVSFPRSRCPTAHSPSPVDSSIEDSQSESDEEDRKRGFLGLYSFNRRSAVRRHASMPGRSSLEEERRGAKASVVSKEAAV